jgi:alkanesulfonate monooxygenase SsuD/methylene tetrahydromethanopterin reductase-like flavin-dependent oxidoreductase (luciferase family)
MQVEFGIWDHFEQRPGVPLARQYQEKVQLICHAERLGFSHYHVAEHHLSPLDMAPSPSVFLAAAAQATSRIRIGTGVFCLPLYQPLRLLQEICMLDNIAGGRLDVGVGRGIRSAEHAWFGIDQAEVRPRFEEVLAFLVQAMSTGRTGFEGRYYRFDDLPLAIEPVQRPYPPFWYAGGVEAAGRGGFNFLSRSVADLQRFWTLWDETRERPDRINAHIPVPKAGLTKHVVVRESYDEAVRIARRAWPVFESHWFATPVLVNEDGQAVPLRGPGSGPQDFDAALRAGTRILVGTPAMLGKQVEEWLEQLADKPAFHFSPAVQWGDISSDEAVESLALIARDVMPDFRVTGNK